MSIIASANSTGSKDFERPESGSYPARSYMLVDLGTQEKEWKGEKSKKHELMIFWELNELMEDGRPFVVNWRGTLSLNENAKLYKLLSDWRGKSFTKDELDGFDVTTVINKPCLLNIATETSANGKEYTNVKSIMPLPKGMEAPELVNPEVIFSISDLGTPAFDKLYPWVQKIVQNSEEYKKFAAEDTEGRPFK